MCVRIIELAACLVILLCGGILIDKLNNELIEEANLSIEGNELVVFCNINGPANVTAEFYFENEPAGNGSTWGMSVGSMGRCILPPGAGCSGETRWSSWTPVRGIRLIDLGREACLRFFIIDSEREQKFLHSAVDCPAIQ
jgi:hypothetical protein